MTIAKIENGVVVQIDRTTNDAPAGWVECPNGVVVGQIKNGSIFENPAVQIDDLLRITKSAIDASMQARFKQGIIWKYNNADDPHPISIDDGAQKLFSYTTHLRGKGRTNSHGGKFRQNDVEFLINDTGLDEVCVFAAEWGLAIKRIGFDQIDSVEVMDITQLAAYDASQIDWTIDWSLDSQNNNLGWDNDTVLQNP